MATETYKVTKNKSFIPHETSFVREDYDIIGWNTKEHRDNTVPDYPVGLQIAGGFPSDTDLYACWDIQYVIIDSDGNDIIDSNDENIQYKE